MKNIALGFSVVLAAALLAGCGGKPQSTVSVFGVGTVTARPDTVQMNISLSKTAPTTRQAQEAVNGMALQALQVLQDAGIADKNISTASLRFNPEYEWGGQRRVLLGQKAEQIIAFSIGNINANTEKVSTIIDRLILINGIELNQINFSVKDSAELFAKSRELACQKAREKAEQYAALSGLKVVKPLRVSEEGVPQIAPMNNRLLNQAANMDYAAAGEAAAGSTALPTGELEITTRILAEFLLK